MIKRKWRNRIIIFLACILLSLSYYYGIIIDESGKEKLQYSVVLYQHMDNEWSALIQGIQQAERDYNLKVNYIFTDDEDGIEGQLAAVKTELNANIDGILLAAADSSFMEEELQAIPDTNLIVNVETGNGEKYITISANDYQMGYQLGRKIIADLEADETTPLKEVVIIKEYLERDSVRKRYEGLKDALNQAKTDFTIKEISRQDKNQSLKNMITTRLSRKGIYIVALDKYVAEKAVEARDAKNKRIKNSVDGIYFYAIGHTARLVGALDSGKIKAIMYQNEFNMGYEGIRALVQKKNVGYVTDNFDIPYRIVTKETLYEAENERVLFPSI